MTRDELDNKMSVLLGGRAAEFVVYAHLSTGAADDLRRVTDIARAMVTRYGMSDKLGGVAYERDPHTFMNGADMAPWSQPQDNYAETTAATIDSEVHDLVQAAMEGALGILREKRDVLERSARKLLEKETLEEKDLIELIGPPAGPPVRVAAE
jgi:cell division protease FtsH